MNSFDSYKERFERLLKNETTSDVEFNFLIEVLIFETPLDAKQLEQTPFFIRASLLEENEPCTNVSRCSYVPDSKKCKIPLQRCNFKEQQVFYASIPGGMLSFSDGAGPALMETMMQKIIDDPTFNAREAAVSRWQIKQQPIFWTLPYHKYSIEKNENFKFFFNHFDDFLKDKSKSNEDYQNFV